MIVVAGTSPLNYLVPIGHIEILAKIYSEVLVPQTVLDELRIARHPQRFARGFGFSGLAANQQPDLPARPPHGQVGPGEQDAILLAESLKAERLIIDDLEHFHFYSAQSSSAKCGFS